MAQFNVHEAESDLSRLLDMALSGEEVLIARHGVPIVSVSAIPSKSTERILGAGRGTVTFLSEDWAAPMSDEEAEGFWEGRW